jgi:two-component system sensor histidine kinase YesM
VGAEKEHGYGIFNVNDRIRMSHGKDYGLRYRRNEAGGVTVTVRCPMNIRADDMQRE